MDDEQPQKFGRRLFLGLVGLGGLATVTAGALGEVGALPAITEDFRIYTVTDGYPSMRRDEWRLEVTGAVARPAVFTFADLESLGFETRTSTFHCVTGWTVHDNHWQGVPLTTLLDHVGAATDRGHAVNFACFDEVYTESLTMEQARLPDNLVAVGLNGKPLSPAQGYPSRMIVPAMYGYKGAKWLSRIDVSKRKDPGYWEVRGYDDDGWVGRSNGYTS